MKIEYNISRLKHLLALYKLTVDELITLVSDGLKKPINESDILSKEIEISYLKRIDKIFNKGLYYYLDPKSPEISKDASIFFRKDKFDTELNIGAKQIVNQFEDFKISLSAIAKLADLKIERRIPVYSINDNAKTVAFQIRKELYPTFTSDKRLFLKELIGIFAKNNILVFEFVETWNKKEKANINGLFLNPNVIVLKRQQTSFRREIFTLSHELGHFLLNEEEIERLDYLNLAKDDITIVEKWCNDFAYYFLAGEYCETINNIDKADYTNDYHFDIIRNISNLTHLSQIAIFTKLLFQYKISRDDYNNIKNDFDLKYREKKDAEKRQRELDKQSGLKPSGSTPKPINSPLLISTIQTAFYEGVINEYDVCKKLKISPNKLNEFIQ